LRTPDGSDLTKCAAIRDAAAMARSEADSGGRGPVSRPRSLDRVDQTIIEALQENGRESFRRIASRAGVAEATVRARYARLCADNILQVTGVTNPLGLGFEAEALVGVNTAGSPEPVADEIASWDESSYVVITAGRFDVIVELVCTDRRHLLELTNRIRELDSVVTTETFPYLQLCKQVYAWGARLDRATAAAAGTG
jgi:Lrp/AsnC family transcriptional regulator for asnA, asnC and gidA